MPVDPLTALRKATLARTEADTAWHKAIAAAVKAGHTDIQIGEAAGVSRVWAWKLRTRTPRRSL